MYFALYARRRMELYGATDDDFAQVKVKNAQPRAAQPERPLPQGDHRRRRAGSSPVVADPLRLLDICATRDGGAAVVLTSMEFAERTRLASTACHA